MSSEKMDRIDQLAEDLGDLRRAADEILEEPPAGVDLNTVQRLKRALDDAVAAADDLEEQSKE
jgi:hypothetical protein